jgi:hypothetical protein
VFIFVAQLTTVAAVATSLWGNWGDAIVLGLAAVATSGVAVALVLAGR